MGRNNQWRESFRAGYEQGRLPGKSRPQRVFGAAALLFVALACGSIAWGNLTGTDAPSAADAGPAVSPNGDGQLAAKTDPLPNARRAYGKLAALLTDYARRVSEDADEVLFELALLLRRCPGQVCERLRKRGIALFARRRLGTNGGGSSNGRPFVDSGGAIQRIASGANAHSGFPR